MRKWIIAALVLLIAGLVMDRARTVDAEEYDVLTSFLTDALPGTRTTGIESTDPSPCWWWCENTILDVSVRAQLVTDRGMTPSERCDQIAGAITALVAVEPELLERPQQRACFFIWWDVAYGGRHVRVDLDITDDPDDLPQIRVENLSAGRVFLPWNKEG